MRHSVPFTQSGSALSTRPSPSLSTPSWQGGGGVSTTFTVAGASVVTTTCWVGSGTSGLAGCPRTLKIETWMVQLPGATSTRAAPGVHRVATRTTLLPLSRPDTTTESMPCWPQPLDAGSFPTKVQVTSTAPSWLHPMPASVASTTRGNPNRRTMRGLISSRPDRGDDQDRRRLRLRVTAGRDVERATLGGGQRGGLSVEHVDRGVEQPGALQRHEDGPGRRVGRTDSPENHPVDVRLDAGRPRRGAGDGRAAGVLKGVVEDQVRVAAVVTAAVRARVDDAAGPGQGQEHGRRQKDLVRAFHVDDSAARDRDLCHCGAQTLPLQVGAHGATSVKASTSVGCPRTT